VLSCKLVTTFPRHTFSQSSALKMEVVGPPTRWYLSASRHVITTQNIAIDEFGVVVMFLLLLHDLLNMYNVSGDVSTVAYR
jgi:hypothetical protein